MSARKDVDAVLEEVVERGAVAVAADEDGVIYETGEPNTVFEVGSIAVTTVAALQQVERGNLDLDEPVQAFLPDFSEGRVRGLVTDQRSLGYVVEVASGLDLPTYLEAHILGPLGMGSTIFEEGRLRSTPQDFLRFQRMLLGGGAFEGVRILERSTVRQALRDGLLRTDPHFWVDSDSGITGAVYPTEPRIRREFELALRAHVEQEA